MPQSAFDRIVAGVIALVLGLLCAVGISLLPQMLALADSGLRVAITWGFAGFFAVAAVATLALAISFVRGPAG